MKLFDIIKNVGSAVVRETVPGGGLLLDAVNAVLPDDKKLPAEATGEDVDRAVAGLPDEQRAALLSREFDVDIEALRQRGDSLRAMLETEQKSQHTTRPYIAKGAFQVVAACSIAVLFTWCGGVWLNRPEIVDKAQDGAPLMLTVLGPMVALLYAYFGVLRKEQQNRLNAAQGKESGSGLGALVGKFLKR